VQFYSSFRELPDPAEGVIVSADLRKTRGLLEELKNSGAKAIWFQQGCFDKKVLAQANELGLDPIKGCAFMYMPGSPVFHRFHRAINDLFGKGYK
jgi:predicted CoA-binding protein